MYIEYEETFDLGIKRFDHYTNTKLLMEAVELEESLSSCSSNVERLYVIEASSNSIGSKIKSAFQKLITMIKNLVSSAHDAIAKKIHKVQLKAQINKIRKAVKDGNLKSSKRPKAGIYSSSVDYVEDYLKYAEKHCKNAIEIYKSSETLEEANEKLKKKTDELNEEFSKFVNCNPDQVYALMIGDALTMSEKDLDEIDKLIVQVDRHSEDLIKELEKLAERDSKKAVSESVSDIFEEDVRDKAKEVSKAAADKIRSVNLSSILTKAASFIAVLAKKVINFMLRHAASIAVLCSHRFAQWFNPDDYAKLKDVMDEKPLVTKESVKPKVLTKENFA